MEKTLQKTKKGDRIESEEKTKQTKRQEEA